MSTVEQSSAIWLHADVRFNAKPNMRNGSARGQAVAHGLTRISLCAQTIDALEDTDLRQRQDRRRRRDFTHRPVSEKTESATWTQGAGLETARKVCRQPRQWAYGAASLGMGCPFLLMRLKRNRYQDAHDL